MLTIKSLTNRESLTTFNSYSENTLEKKDLLKKIKNISQQTNDLYLYSHDKNSSPPLLIKNDAKMITLKNVIKFIIGLSFFPCGAVIYRKVSSVPHYAINSYIDDQNEHIFLNISSVLINETESRPLLIKTKRSISNYDNKTIKKKQSILITPIDIITPRNKRLNAKPWRYRKNAAKPILKHIKMVSISQALF